MGRGEPGWGARTAGAHSIELSLEGGWLERTRVIDRWQLEIVGGAPTETPDSPGCVVEIIAYAPQVLVPVDRPEVVEAVLRRHPVNTVLDGAAV